MMMAIIWIPLAACLDINLLNQRYSAQQAIAKSYKNLETLKTEAANPTKVYNGKVVEKRPLVQLYEQHKVEKARNQVSAALAFLNDVQARIDIQKQQNKFKL